MPSPIGSFTQGMLTGRAEAASKKQAQAKAQADAQAAQLAQYNKDRTHNLQAGAELRQVRSAAQSAWDNILTKSEASTGTDMGLNLMKEAAGYDRSFGDVLNTGSLEAHIARKLHMGTGGPQAEGKQGPPSPADVTSSPIAGFTDKLAKLKHEAGVETEETKNLIGEIRENLHKVMLEKGSTDGILDHSKVHTALLEYQLKLEAEYPLDHDVIQKAFQEYRKDAADVLDEIAGQTADPEAVKKEYRLLDTSMERWITGRFKGKLDFESGLTNIFDANDRVTAQKMSLAKAQYVSMNYDQPAIEVLLAEQFLDEKTGRWIGGAQASNRDKALAAGGGGFALAVQKLFEIDPNTGEPYVDPLLVKAAYDEKTGYGALLWITPDENYGQPVNGGPIYKRPEAPFIAPGHGVYTPPPRTPAEIRERAGKQAASSGVIR